MLAENIFDVDKEDLPKQLGLYRNMISQNFNPVTQLSNLTQQEEGILLF